MNDPRRANRTWRDRLSVGREPGAPPDVPQFARPAQPQPVPQPGLASQVFSTYGALPTGGRMFALAVEADGVLNDSGVILFTFELPPQRGWITVLRSLQLVPPSLGEVNGETSVDVPPIGTTEFALLKDGSMVPNVSTLPAGRAFGPFACWGNEWPVYVVGGEQNTLGCAVRQRAAAVPSPWDELALTMIFRGEYLRARNLQLELETGHDAPIVRATPYVRGADDGGGA